MIGSEKIIFEYIFFPTIMWRLQVLTRSPEFQGELVENQPLALFRRKKATKIRFTALTFTPSQYCTITIFFKSNTADIYCYKNSTGGFCTYLFYLSLYLFHECNVINLIQLLNKLIAPLLDLLNQASTLKICNHYES